MSNETIADIVAELRRCPTNTALGGIVSLICNRLADRIEAAAKREEEHEGDAIEQIVRDAIVSYQEMFPHAPNDDAERELTERAKRGNDWLVRHGYAQENCVWNKEEEPCL